VEGNLALSADLVGAWVEAGATNGVSAAIGAALRSPLATGNTASWRRPDAPREVVSAPCGSYRRAALLAIGGFDEGQIVNEDYEANYRLRQAGGRVFLSPDVTFTYFPRDSLSALARQFARYGYHKARVMVKHPGSIRWRHLTPALAVAAAAALGAGAAWARPALLALAAAVALYLVGLLLAGAAARRGLGRPAILLPAVFATMHIAWGIGNLIGLLRWLPARRGLRGVGGSLGGVQRDGATVCATGVNPPRPVRGRP
jgi:hypothetical protein